MIILNELFCLYSYFINLSKKKLSLVPLTQGKTRKFHFDRKLSVYWLCLQGSHRLEKYLNIQDCLEKPMKIKYSLKST